MQNSLTCTDIGTRRGKKGETDDEEDNDDAEKKKLRKGLEGSLLYTIWVSSNVNRCNFEREA